MDSSKKVEYQQTRLCQYFSKFKSNGFKLIKQNTPEFEFERLRKLMKWGESAAQSQKISFAAANTKTLPNPPKPKKTLPNNNQNCTKKQEPTKTQILPKKQQKCSFFDCYQKYNGFKRVQHNPPETEFERLASHMKWDNAQYYSHRTIFLESIQKENTKIKEEKSFIPKNQNFPPQKKNPSFFDCYEKNSGFKRMKPNNSFEEFERLASFMNWNNSQYYAHKNIFLKSIEMENLPQNNNNNQIKQNLENQQKKQNSNQNIIYVPKKQETSFFDCYEKHSGFKRLKNNDFYEEFERLADFMHWNNSQYNSHRAIFLKSIPAENYDSPMIINPKNYKNADKNAGIVYVKKEEHEEHYKHDKKKEIPIKTKNNQIHQNIISLGNLFDAHMDEESKMEIELWNCLDENVRLTNKNYGNELLLMSNNSTTFFNRLFGVESKLAICDEERAIREALEFNESYEHFFN